jgi:hypothetical protein
VIEIDLCEVLAHSTHVASFLNKILGAAHYARYFLLDVHHAYNACSACAGASDKEFSKRKRMFASLLRALGVIVLAMQINCTGSLQLAKPWAAPMQYSTGLADTPFPPRDFAMFDAVNGRVLMWSDVIDLTAWADVIVISHEQSCPGGVWMQDALTEDVLAAFPPSSFFESTGDVATVVTELDNSRKDSRRVVIHYMGTDPLHDVASAIRKAHRTDNVFTIALVSSSVRFLRNEDVRKADVVAYTAPTRVVPPSDLQSDQPRSPKDLEFRK